MVMRYSVQPRDPTFVKGWVFLSFAKNIGKNVGKNISKNLRTKYSQNLLDHAKQSATDALKTASKWAIQKAVEATGDSIDNKITARITKGSKPLADNNLETNKEEILRERFIPSELRHKVINELTLRK